MPNVLTVPRTQFRIARTVSDIMSPPALALPALLMCAWANDFAATYRFALLYVAVGVGLPALFVFWQLKAGRITDFHLPDRRDRIGPFIVSLVCGLLSFGLLVYADAPHGFLTPILAIQLQVLVLFLITLVWQVSIHTATMACLVIFAVLQFGNAALFLFALVPLVGWARLYLGRHSLMQTVTGAVIGCCCFPLLFRLCELTWVTAQ